MSLENPEALWDGKTLIPTSDISKRHEKLYAACGLKLRELKDMRLEEGGPLQAPDMPLSGQ